MRTRRAFGLPFLLMLLLGIQCYAAVPYPSYTYNFWGEAMPAPQAFIPLCIISGREAGIGEFNKPQDLFAASDDRIYLADSGNNRVICFDREWNVKQTFSEFYNGGQLDTFMNPTGVFVTSDGRIYIADRGNARIVELNRDGEFVREIGPPESSDIEKLVSEQVTYKPLKLVVDGAGRIYVIAEGIYHGLLKFTKDGTFRGLIGAPRVRPNVADYIWARIATEEQRRRMSLFLPIEYNGIDVDQRGFIYAVASGSSIEQTEVIRRLNPSGYDVLTRRGFFPPVGDVDYPPAPIPNTMAAVVQQHKGIVSGPSEFIDIAVHDLGIYSALDKKRGRVFTYDSRGHLLYTLGGLGNQMGTFTTPVALEYVGERIAVLDSGTNSVTVFEPTDYTRRILGAIGAYEAGDYELSTAIWQEVLAMNGNYKQAYVGIGRASLREGKYQEAMRYFRYGDDRESYSEAYSRYRREILGTHFGTIVMLIMLFVALIAVGSVSGLFERWREQIGCWWLSKDRGTIGEIVDGLGYSLHLVFHPFDGFWDLKHEKRGNVLSSTMLMGLVTLVYLGMRQYTGFIFNLRDLTKLNLFSEMASVLIPFGLWCLVNWALTTLMEGKGTIRDVFVASAYAFTPIIIINIPNTLLSNYITLEEGAFYYFFLVVSIIWFIVLMFIGSMVTHQYQVGKTVFASILTIGGIGICLFLALLLFNLFDQVVAFLSDLYVEVYLRL